MSIDIEEIKAAAKAAGGQPWTVDGYIVLEEVPGGSKTIGRVGVAYMLACEAADFIGTANPAAVLELIERLESAEQRASEMERRYDRLTLTLAEKHARLECAEAALRDIANDPDEHGETREKARVALSGGSHG